ncbi:MAG: type III pantothenate kinase [Bacteroidales bacterium]|nr:type III pantothenate kinase [Bacteroidales bacterium]
MNLAIDIGNSFYKLGIFDGDHKVFVTRTPELTIDFLNELNLKYNIEKLIYSSVKGNDKVLESLNSKRDIIVLEVNALCNLPFSIEYLSPDTLGSDRLAAVAGAYNKFKDSNVLIIDAGTAVTYDLLLAKGVYKGGNISPGLSMRFKALNTFTGKLPLVIPDYKYDMIGNNTVEAIRTGVQQGLIYEINEYIRNFKIGYKDLEIVITGGDGEFISDKVEYPLEFIEDLVIEGLNYILNYNA